MRKIGSSLLLAVCLVSSADAESARLIIATSQPVAKSSPMLYGLMTEEINHSYDGGLYAELVRNRAFLDDAKTPVHWSAVGSATITLDPKQPLNAALPVSLRLDAPSASPSAVAGVANGGYWGIPVKPETRYRASFFAKAAPDFSGPVAIAIESDDGATVYAKAEVPRLTADWKSYEITLTTGKVAPTAKARLVLTVDRPGTVWFSLVSLFPPTWKGRPNGLRPDLMQMLVDLQPAFLRFPGGNYLEGGSVETRFDWKKTLGPISGRPGNPGTWGYRSSDGMGLLEFLTWCEDLGAEPVLAVYAGYSLNHSHIEAGPALAPFVQDALDEIEYVTGSPATKWGARRAQDGHPAPFPLRYVEIGNEDWFDKSGSYGARFTQFRDAIEAKYPPLKCISTLGHDQPEALKRMPARPPAVIDEHYYLPAEKFLRAAAHFDQYDRHGPKIFVGEWAAHETSFPPWDKRSKTLVPTPNMRAALGDAAWMAAMERNSDIVIMQCYAPLLANVNGYQWRPDLIGYDALRAYGSPSYYAFQMFSRHHGGEILKTTISGAPIHASVTKDEKTGTIFIKLVNPQPAPQPLAIDLRGASTLAPTATVTTLSAAPDATNSIEDPVKVVPVQSEVAGIKPAFVHTLPPSSIVVLEIRTGATKLP